MTAISLYWSVSLPVHDDSTSLQPSSVMRPSSSFIRLTPEINSTRARLHPSIDLGVSERVGDDALRRGACLRQSVANRRFPRMRSPTARAAPSFDGRSPVHACIPRRRLPHSAPRVFASLPADQVPV